MALRLLAEALERHPPHLVSLLPAAEEAEASLPMLLPVIPVDLVEVAPLMELLVLEVPATRQPRFHRKAMMAETPFSPPLDGVAVVAAHLRLGRTRSPTRPAMVVPDLHSKE